MSPAADKQVPRLDIYVAEHCFGCTETRRLAEAAASRFPALSVHVVDLDREPGAHPEGLVAVPTYMLDGQVVCLGNPEPSDLFRCLQRSLDPGHRAG